MRVQRSQEREKKVTQGHEMLKRDTELDHELRLNDLHIRVTLTLVVWSLECSSQ